MQFFVFLYSGHSSGDETSGDGQFSGGGLCGISHRNAVHFDGVIDEGLASGDQEKQDGIENDEHSEGIGEALEVLTCDRQRDTNTALLVKVPVRRHR